MKISPWDEAKAGNPRGMSDVIYAACRRRVLLRPGVAEVAAGGANRPSRRPNHSSAPAPTKAQQSSTPRGRHYAAFLVWLGQTLASSAIVILGFVAVRSTGIGERFLSHHLDRRIAALKHEQDQQIEQLRSQLVHLQDRGRRANELEFDALTKVWDAFVDAWLKTQQAIVQQMSYPDLDNLTSDDLRIFLESTDLSEQQRKQVLEASNKKDMYSKISRLRQLNLSGAAIYEGRQVLRTSGIYISAQVAQVFRDALSKLSAAQVERYIEFQHARSMGYEKSMEVLDPSGMGMLADLEAVVRRAIRRD